SWMNTSINPCDDFYSFTCGAGTPDQQWSFNAAHNEIAQTMITELSKPASWFDDNEPLPVRQMKWFYDACLAGATDQEDINGRAARIFNDLRKANPNVGFPALYPGQTTKATADQLAAFLGYAISTGLGTSLVNLEVDADWKDSQNEKGGYVLYTDHAIPFFVPAYYTKVYNKDDVINNIMFVFMEGAQLLGIEKVDQKQLQQDASDLAQFDYDLATKYSTDERSRHQQMDSMYNPYTVDGLQQLAPFLQWTTFFNNALTPISTTVDGSFRVIAKEVDKLALISADIVSGAIPSRTVNNYLYFHALSQLDLPKPFQKSAHLSSFRQQNSHSRKSLRHQLDQPIGSQDAHHTYTPAYCEQLTSGHHLWANTRLFVDALYPTPESRQQLEDQTGMFLNSLVAAFRAQIDLLDWMTPAAKKGAYQKIDNLVANVGAPNWVLDDQKLSWYYEKCDTKQSDSYLVQLDKLTAFGVYEWMYKIVDGSPVDRKDFYGPTAVADAYYTNHANSITLPMGILRAPFFDVNNPAALNYGALGFIASHELTLGFDDVGSQWEGTGLLNSWTDANSSKSFSRMAQCVVNEYDKFCPLGTGMPCVDGRQTQRENVADNGGIQTAYKAFKAFEALHGPDPLLPGAASTFNADQLFFLSFGQIMCQYPPSAAALLGQILVAPFSPPQYGVLGTLQNTPAFQKAFNCPAESTYAPAKHCNVWTSESTSGAPQNAKGEPVVPGNDLNIAPVNRISPQDMDKYTAYQGTLGIFQASANMSKDPCDDFYHYSCEAFPGEKQTTSDMAQNILVLINNQLNDPDYQATIEGTEALTKLKTLYNSCKAEAKNPTIATTNYLKPKVDNFRSYINQAIPLMGGTNKVDITPDNYGNALGYLSFQLGIDTLVTPEVDTYWPDPQANLLGHTNGYQLFVDQPTTYHARAFYEDANWKNQKPSYKSTVKTVVEAYAKQDKTVKLPADSDGQCKSVMRTLANRHVPEHIGHLPGRRQRLPAFVGFNDEDDDGIGCVDQTGVMADAQGRVYIDARFPTEKDRTKIRDTMTGVIKNIVDAMKGMIMQLDWMTEPSKTKAVAKVSNIQVNVAFPDFILDDTELNARYKDLVFEKADAYYDMLDKVTIFSINQQFALLTSPKADRKDFLGQTAVVNAWYDPELNSITFPAGILQQPYFDVDYPAGLNYGGIGIVAGHELTHGFDDEGVQWDFDGRLNIWMDNTSQDGFNSMAQCVIDQYGQFCPLPDDRSPNCIDGVRTQGENIADNGGIHSAWRAYGAHIELDGPDPLFMDRMYSQFTENQLFFRNYAQLWCQQKTMLTESYVTNKLLTDPHSLPPYRILGTLQNIPAFRANYNCPLNSTYAPENHCNVWVPTKMA
ncbi:hypothetical protein PENTCL1PPCAC_21960, partial [Pristionchus entomophagus]